MIHIDEYPQSNNDINSQRIIKPQETDKSIFESCIDAFTERFAERMGRTQ